MESKGLGNKSTDDGIDWDQAERIFRRLREIRVPTHYNTSSTNALSYNWTDADIFTAIWDAGWDWNHRPTARRPAAYNTVKKHFETRFKEYNPEFSKKRQTRNNLYLQTGLERFLSEEKAYILSQYSPVIRVIIAKHNLSSGRTAAAYSDVRRVYLRMHPEERIHFATAKNSSANEAYSASIESPHSVSDVNDDELVARVPTSPQEVLDNDVFTETISDEAYMAIETPELINFLKLFSGPLVED